MKAVKVILVVLTLVGGITMVGKIGNSERTDEIIRSMDQDVYNDICDSLRIHGEYPSDEEVAEFYLENYDK